MSGIGTRLANCQCLLLIIFAKNLDPGQARQNVGHDLDPNCLTFWCYSWKIVFLLLFFIQFNIPFKIISLIETSQLVGGAKSEYPGKTTWHTRKQNLACLTCGQCRARTYTRHSGEMIEWLRALKFSDLTHSATGAASKDCFEKDIFF